MKILIKDDLVDFEAPICMTRSQRDKFIKLMEKRFPKDSKIRYITEKTKEPGERSSTPKKWTPDDLFLLVTSKDAKALFKKMERGEMSIWMKAADFVPDFLRWTKEKGYSLPITKKMIREFLNEMGGK